MLATPLHRANVPPRPLPPTASMLRTTAACILPRLCMGAGMSLSGSARIGKRTGPVAARPRTGRLLRHGIRRFRRILPDTPSGSLDRLAVLLVVPADTPGPMLLKRRLHPRPGRLPQAAYPTGFAPRRTRESEHLFNGIVVNKTVDNRSVGVLLDCHSSSSHVRSIIHPGQSDGRGTCPFPRRRISMRHHRYEPPSASPSPAGYPERLPRSPVLLEAQAQAPTPTLS